MQDRDFDRTEFPYDAMGDYSVFIKTAEKKEKPPCEDPDKKEITLSQG